MCWRKGHLISCVPALWLGDALMHYPPEMVKTLFTCFFPSNSPSVSTTHPSNSLLLLTHTHNSISASEISACLWGTSNSSVPGPSRIGYKLLKWAFTSAPDHFTILPSLQFGSHDYSSTVNGAGHLYHLHWLGNCLLRPTKP
jgi:hypothetical protein